MHVFYLEIRALLYILINPNLNVEGCRSLHTEKPEKSDHLSCGSDQMTGERFFIDILG